MSIKSFKYMPILETIGITLIYILIGLTFNKEDPLFIDTKVPFILILSIFITLYHGLKYGLLSLLILAPIIYLYYPNDYINIFLVYILLVLILGQFYHYWRKKINRLEGEFEFTSQRLETLSNAFYTLKISHDALEKSYVLKPYSIRGMFQELETMFFKDGSQYKNFLYLLNSSFKVNKSVMAIHDGKEFRTIANLEDTTLNINDALVQKAIQTQQTSFVNNDALYEGTNYLAVIPLKSKQESIIAILAIQKMPFMEFHKNNIIAISILFSYFLDQVKLRHQHSISGDTRSKNIYFESMYESMENLQKNYGTQGSILVIKTDDMLIKEQITQSIQSHIRDIDRYMITPEGNILVLFPFTTKEMTSTIVAKIIGKYQNNSSIEYLALNITQEELIQRYIKE